MKQATVIYPHQLFTTSPALDTDRDVYLVEEQLILTFNPIHKQKLMFHKLSMDSYETKLVEQGYTVKRLAIATYPTTASVFEKLEADGVEQMHIVDTTDQYLEQAITTSGLERIWYESPLFILDKKDAVERYLESKRFMAQFYKKLRQDKKILVDEAGKPTGGKWSFDEDNRKKIPKNTDVPEDISFFGNEATVAAEAWSDTVEADVYGEAGCWLPYTQSGAEKFLKEFLRTRFHTFGPYEDAMTTKGVRLWHSALSPLINVGLLTPQYVLERVLDFAKEHDTPLNSLEGFVRQILGWREFIRASYEVDGNTMRTSNFFSHHQPLPAGFWTAKTTIDPVDHAISTALTHGYTHHIERLMILGNFMLLHRIDPNEVYRWFMGMYVDAYDWVMVPNVYGMSQFADGGSFATKPYISGANYIKKMSDFPTGEWEEIWTALYWNFIDTHSEYFKSNHRLSMMPRTLERMKPETREKHFAVAKTYLAK